MIQGRNADFATNAPVVAGPIPDPNLIWVRGAGRWANYDGVNGGPGASIETGAVFAGLDLPINEGLRVGVAGGWSDSSFDMDDNSGTLDADAWHGSLYATGASGNWRTKGIVTYERYDLSSRNPVEFDTQIARADYHADHIEALGEVSYVQAVGATSAIEPYLSAGVSWAQVDGFTEKVNGGDYLAAGQQEETWAPIRGSACA
jgi:fibronectin-binding autotransporter adhesin